MDYLINSIIWENYDNFKKNFINSIEDCFFGKDFDALERLALKEYTDPIFSKYVLNHHKIKPIASKIRSSWQAYERDFEKEFANKYLKGDSNSFKQHLKKNFNLVKREGLMAKLNDISDVLVLGGGAVPLTAIMYNKLFGCNVNCIDIDSEAISISKKLLEKLRIKRISVEHQDATESPIKAYDLILVTTHCMPKREIFRHLFEKIDKSKVIYRTPIGLFKLFYDETKKSDISGFKRIKSKINKGCFIESVLLKKV
jgi:histidine 2-aminobutanoyltransferase